MSVVICKILFFALVLHQCTAVIYHLNASEYSKMPPVFQLDPFEECTEVSEAVYCLVEFVPVANTPHALLDTMREYSEHTKTHFNHTLMRYGVCLNLCKQYNTTAELRPTLEACLNESFWNKYRLNTSLQHHRCDKIMKKIEFEVIDIVMLVVLIAILLLNCIGSYCEFKFTTKEKGLAMRALMFFSIRRNWRKLVSPAANGPEPRLERLKFFSGLKSITMILVIASHSLVSAYFYIDNTKFIEEYYKNLGIQLLLNGTILVQTFFVIAGFLLSYNQLLLSEKRKVGWSMLPIGIIMRWIRLTPVYALAMLFTLSWMRFVGNGATWTTAVTGEVEDCRKYWWQHLIYINNYNGHSQCFPQSWYSRIFVCAYIAADFQLYCLGLVVLIGCRSVFSRKMVISILLIAGLVIPPLQTYFENLDGIVVITPETLNHFLLDNPTYNKLYRSGHTNLFNYALGLAAGYLVYHLQQTNFNIEKYKAMKYTILFWFCIVVQVPVVMSGSIFYKDGPLPTTAIKLAFAAFMKPAYGVCFTTGMIYVVFKLDNVTRFILEWRIWAVLGRLSYSTYILHLSIARIVWGQKNTLDHVSIIFMSQQSVYILFLSIIAAIPFWFFVEQPFGQLLKVFLAPKRDEKVNDQNGAKQEEVDVTAQNNPTDMQLTKINV